MLEWNLSNSHHHKVQSCASCCHSPYYHSLMSDWIYDDSLGNQIHKKLSLSCYFPWKQLVVWKIGSLKCQGVCMQSSGEMKKRERWFPLAAVNHYTGLTASLNLKSHFKMSTKDKKTPLRLKYFNHLSITYYQEKPSLTANLHRIFSSYSIPSLLDGSHLFLSFKRYLSCKYKLLTYYLSLLTSFHFQCGHISFLMHPSDWNNIEIPAFVSQKHSAWTA